MGAYAHAAFETTGTGQFMPLAGSQPFVGAANQLERVAETRVEIMAVGAEQVRAAVAKLKQAHPYEEVAYDVFKMENF
ncbi:uncharacterized protein V1510DRAFT_416912 [Dipodascopsis tothii]|uniref:uncharacterized protein n=1 Tax=Dipodascopsis tothii TaxID=44089 RepID=UPI0034D014D2